MNIANRSGGLRTTAPCDGTSADPARSDAEDEPGMGRSIVTGRDAIRCLVLMIAVASGGCGYQLRGAAAPPSGLEAVRVSGPGDIRNEVTQLLESGGVGVEPADAGAGPVLHLSGERFSRRVLSVDPNTGKAREFEVAYRVAFRLVGGDAVEMVPKQSVTLLRDYVFDADAVLGKSREQRVLQDEMRRDAAARIVRRIASALER